MGIDTALIVGITGQDGAYLASKLLSKNYRVLGTSRDCLAADTSRLQRLGIAESVEMIDLIPSSFQSIISTLKEIKVEYIYNLSGQSSVGLSFGQPLEAFESISTATINFLEAIRLVNRDIRYFSAGSTEMYGETGLIAIDENGRIAPESPYAVAKAASYWSVKNYRSSYGLHACTGILSNHESPLRAKRYVIPTIIEGVRKIRSGEQNRLCLGNLDISRDWGWASEYVDAMIKITESDIADDYIVATGRSTSLRHIIDIVCQYFSVNPNYSIVSNEESARPSDHKTGRYNPTQIKKNLDWQANKTIEDIVISMIEDNIF